MTGVKVKICGITNVEDAICAIELGVDALGFIFAPSPRQVSPEQVREIICMLPPFIQTIGVFVNEDPDRITWIKNYCGLNMVQLHGDEPPDTCKKFMPGVIKVFQLRDVSSLEAVRPYRGMVRAFLFDTYSAEKRGGTGRTFDWNLAVKGKDLGEPVILSGGLGPENIHQAIVSVNPYAVDVNSGVEDSPGKKSALLLKELMKNIKSAI